MENNWDKHKYTFPNRVFECDSTAADGTDSGCVSVYMMWMLPGATGFLEFLFGATANFLSRPGGAVRMIAVLMMIFGLGTYIQVSISGVEMGIADDIIQFVVLFVGMFLMLLFAAAGRKKISKIIKDTGVETKVAAATNHPIMKGFLLCAIGPALPAALLISAVSSACRRIGLTLSTESIGPANSGKRKRWSDHARMPRGFEVAFRFANNDYRLRHLDCACLLHNLHRRR